jgi:AcrR family transcriptional regulator/DNA-binding MarR family transcriptional regulator
MLSSAVQVICEYGYGELSVARITNGAGVSRRTFYDLFTDREDCFLALFEESIGRVRELVSSAHAGERGWPAQTRAALAAFLLLLDREPGMRSLLIVDALKAGPRVQERRAAVLAQLSAALHEAGSRARPGRNLPVLTGEGVTGAVLGVIHTRLLAKRPGAMIDLLNSLMGLIVLPYLGPAAAERELQRPAPSVPVTRETSWRLTGDPLAGVSMRVTHRTLLVLGAIGVQPGASNRQVADHAGISDQGQISKLLTRLEGLGLIQNSGGQQPSGGPNEWRLTPRGEQVEHAVGAQAPARGDKRAAAS